MNGDFFPQEQKEIDAAYPDLVKATPRRLTIHESMIPLIKRVLNSHLIVRIDNYKRPVGSVIIIPDKYQRSSTKGTVLAIADDITDIEVGDKVLYSQFGGYLLIFDGQPAMRTLGYNEVLSILQHDAPDVVSEGS